MAVAVGAAAALTGLWGTLLCWLMRVWLVRDAVRGAKFGLCLSLQSKCGWRGNCALKRSSKNCSASWLHQQLQCRLLQCALHGGTESGCQSGFAKRNPVWQLQARYCVLSSLSATCSTVAPASGAAAASCRPVLANLDACRAFHHTSCT